MQLDSQIVKKINDYYTTCKLKYYYHLKAAEKYKVLYIYTTAPIIVLSSITTVLASYNGNIVDVRLAIAVAIISGITTVGHALVSFFEYNSQYQAHIVASNKFTNLSRLIETEFFTHYLNTSTSEETNIYIKSLFEKLYREFMNIQDNAPYLPTYISERAYPNVQYGAENINDVLIIVDPITNSIVSPLLGPSAGPSAGPSVSPITLPTSYPIILGPRATSSMGQPLTNSTSPLSIVTL